MSRTGEAVAAAVAGAVAAAVATGLVNIFITTVWPETEELDRRRRLALARRWEATRRSAREGRER